MLSVGVACRRLGRLALGSDATGRLWGEGQWRRGSDDQWWLQAEATPRLAVSTAIHTSTSMQKQYFAAAFTLAMASSLAFHCRAFLLRVLRSRASSFKHTQQEVVAPGSRAVRPAVHSGQELQRDAYTIICPRTERRNGVVAAKRRDARAEEELAARQAQRAEAVRSQPVLGTAPTGELLGGESPLPERQARLQYFAKQQVAERASQRQKQLALKAQREAPYAAKKERARQLFVRQQEQQRRAAARAVCELPGLRRRREVLLGGGAEDGSRPAAGEQTDVEERVHLLLDMFANRMCDGRGEEVQTCQRMLCRVLGNALTKCEPKYRRLKARNERLWGALLQQCGAYIPCTSAEAF